MDFIDLASSFSSIKRELNVGGSGQIGNFCRISFSGLKISSECSLRFVTFLTIEAAKSKLSNDFLSFSLFVSTQGSAFGCFSLVCEVTHKFFSFH
jgi:hypothetical protein